MFNFNKELLDYLPLIAPLIIIQLILALVAAKQILSQKSFLYLNKWLWLGIVLILQFFGPLAYFTIGKKEKE